MCVYVYVLGYISVSCILSVMFVHVYFCYNSVLGGRIETAHCANNACCAFNQKLALSVMCVYFFELGSVSVLGRLCLFCLYISIF